MATQGFPAAGIIADHVIAFTGDPANPGTPASLLPPGRAAADDSVPVVLSTEDKASLDGVSPDSLPVSGSATSAAVLFTQDCVGYESISVQVTSAGSSCTITYETSDDNSTWVSSAGLVSSQVGASVPAVSHSSGCRRSAKGPR